MLHVCILVHVFSPQLFFTVTETIPFEQAGSLMCSPGLQSTLCHDPSGSLLIVLLNLSISLDYPSQKKELIFKKAMFLAKVRKFISMVLSCRHYWRFQNNMNCVLLNFSSFLFHHFNTVHKTSTFWIVSCFTTAGEGLKLKVMSFPICCLFN